MKAQTRPDFKPIIHWMHGTKYDAFEYRCVDGLSQSHCLVGPSENLRGARGAEKYTIPETFVAVQHHLHLLCIILPRVEEIKTTG